MAMITTVQQHILQQQQDALNQATVAAHKFQLDLVQKQAAAARETLRQAAPAMVVYTVAASDLPNWQKAARTVRDLFAKEAGPAELRRTAIGRGAP